MGKGKRLEKKEAGGPDKAGGKEFINFILKIYKLYSVPGLMLGAINFIILLGTNELIICTLNSETCS